MIAHDQHIQLRVGSHATERTTTARQSVRCQPLRWVTMDDWKHEGTTEKGRVVRHLPTGCVLRVEGPEPYLMVRLVEGPDFKGIFELATEAIEYVRVMEA